jgi:hypothetical protein
MPALAIRMSMRPAAVPERRCGALHGGEVGLIDDLEAGGRPEPGGGVLDEGGVAVPKRNPGAARGEALGDGEADALGAAGDHGHAAFEIDPVHGELLRRAALPLALRPDRPSRRDGQCLHGATYNVSRQNVQIISRT